MADEHYVYHASWEPSPRATASGDQNIVGLGYIMDNPIVRGLLPSRVSPTPVRGGPIVTHPDGPTPICPAWGCSGPPNTVPVDGGIPINRWPLAYPYGSTSTVQQPPPSAGGSNVVPVVAPLPMSPAPSPTVGVSSSQTAPQLTQPGTTLDSSGGSITTSSGIGAWLSESTLISGIPNWGIAAGAALALVMLMGGKTGRR